MVVNIIETLHVYNLEHLSDIIASRYDEEFKKDNDSIVGVIAYYDDMKKILANLLLAGYDIKSIEINEPSYNNYVDEYSLTILDNEIYLEPLKNEKGKYLFYEVKVLYVLEDVCHKCLNNGLYDKCYEVDIDEDMADEIQSVTCNGDCACCEEYCSEDEEENKDIVQKDNNMHTISFGKMIDNEYSQLSISADSIDLAQMYADKIVDLFYK